MLGDHRGEDAAAHVELRGEAHEPRLRRGDQIVQNAVGHIFVEMTLIAERPHVKFKALQFHALLIRNVIKDQGGKIGLTGFGAEAGELGNLHMDMVIALRVRIGEGLECFAGTGSHCWLPLGVRLECGAL